MKRSIFQFDFLKLVPSVFLGVFFLFKLMEAAAAAAGGGKNPARVV